MKKSVEIKNMITMCKQYICRRPHVKMTVGVLLVVIGFAALVTPLTPGSWLAIIGLELLGFRLAVCDHMMQGGDA